MKRTLESLTTLLLIVTFTACGRAALDAKIEEPDFELPVSGQKPVQEPLLAKNQTLEVTQDFYPAKTTSGTAAYFPAKLAAPPSFSTEYGMVTLEIWAGAFFAYCRIPMNPVVWTFNVASDQSIDFVPLNLSGAYDKLEVSADQRTATLKGQTTATKSIGMKIRVPLNATLLFRGGVNVGTGWQYIGGAKTGAKFTVRELMLSGGLLHSVMETGFVVDIHPFGRPPLLCR